MGEKNRTLGAKQRRRKRRLEKMEDRLSNLPRDVLLHILSFLKTEEAVRTCVLSTGWRLLWTQVPSLHLDIRSFTSDDSFYNFVDHVLFYKDTSTNLRDFKLSLCNVSTLKRVIRYLMLYGRNLQNLFLSFNYYLELETPLFLMHLFTWESLTTLTLQYLQIPFDLHLHFVSLTTLSLEDCKLHTCKISAPQLSQLRILLLQFEGLDEDLKLVLSTPKLSSFSYVGYHLFDLSIMPPHPALQKVGVRLYPRYYPVQLECLINMFGQLHTAKRVTLSTDILYALILNEAPYLLESSGVEEFIVRKEDCPIDIPINVLHYLLTTFSSAQRISLVGGLSVLTEIARVDDCVVVRGIGLP